MTRLEAEYAEQRIVFSVTHPDGLVRCSGKRYMKQMTETLADHETSCGHSA